MTLPVNVASEARLPKNVALVIGGAVVVAGIVWTTVALIRGGDVIIGKLRYDAATGQWVTDFKRHV